MPAIIVGLQGIAREGHGKNATLCVALELARQNLQVC